MIKWLCIAAGDAICIERRERYELAGASPHCALEKLSGSSE
jgi:hypothetical protein